MKVKPDAIERRRAIARANLAVILARDAEDPTHRDTAYLRALFDAHDWVEQEIFREGRHYTRKELEHLVAGV